MTDLSAYRPNVGVVLFHADGRVWLGRRAKAPEPYSWQFPQGGVDDGEDLQAAAIRELHEETGARSVSHLGRTEGWLTYDFPPEHTGSKIARGWKGQKQVWFALRFEGQDAEIDLTAHGPPEFGTTALPIPEALDRLRADGVELDTIRIRSFPFGDDVRGFIERHDIVFLAEQNRDAQMKTLLVNDLSIDPARIDSVLYYGGFSISADTIYEQVSNYFQARKLPRLRAVRGRKDQEIGS